MLSKFHFDVLSFIIESNPDYVNLKEQLPFLTVIDIEHTGIGCFYTYSLNDDFDISKLNLQVNDLILDMGSSLNSEKLPEGAQLILLIKNKKIETLEVMSNGDNYPSEELSDYSFKEVSSNYIQIKTTANSG